MKKVLSTKLKVDQVERLTAMAEQRGESKAEYLRNLVLDCINNGGRVDRAESIGRPQPTVYTGEDPRLDKTNRSADISCCTNSLPVYIVVYEVVGMRYRFLLIGILLPLVAVINCTPSPAPDSTPTPTPSPSPTPMITLPLEEE